MVLTSFLVTFACTRLLVLLIMARRLPDLYLHVGGTHVHHLNYGIFVLAVVGAVLLFAPPSGRWRYVVAAFYGIGLALTFDEFGMWLHLGGSYWQRASFDAVTIVGGLLLLFAYTPPAAKWTRRGIVDAILVLALLGVFFWQLSVSLSSFAQRALPTLERIERQGPR